MKETDSHRHCDPGLINTKRVLSKEQTQFSCKYNVFVSSLDLNVDNKDAFDTRLTETLAEWIITDGQVGNQTEFVIVLHSTQSYIKTHKVQITFCET